MTSFNYYKIEIIFLQSIDQPFTLIIYKPGNRNGKSIFVVEKPFGTLQPTLLIGVPFKLYKMASATMNCVE